MASPAKRAPKVVVPTVDDAVRFLKSSRIPTTRIVLNVPTKTSKTSPLTRTAIARPPALFGLEEKKAPIQCKMHDFQINKEEFSYDVVNRPEDYVKFFSRLKKFPDSTPDSLLSAMCHPTNYDAVDETSKEKMRQSFSSIKRHLVNSRVLTAVVKAILQFDPVGKSVEEIVSQGKLCKTSLSRCLTVFCKEVLKLDKFLGDSNLDLLLDTLSSNFIRWPLGFELFKNIPQLNMKSIPWLRTLHSPDPIVNKGIRTAVRSWTTVFFVKLIVHLMRRVFVLCAGNRAQFHTLYPHWVYSEMKLKGFEKYKGENDVIRLEAISEEFAFPLSSSLSTLSEREMWMIVDGKKTRALARIASENVKRREQRLNAVLRACVTHIRNDMQDCPKIMDEIRQKLGNKRRFVFKTDIAKCYDNILLEEVMKLVVETVESAFMSHTDQLVVLYEYVSKSNRVYKTAAAFGRNQAYDRMKNKLVRTGGTPPNQNVFEIFKSADIIRGIREMLFSVPIKYKDDYYLQKRGIPQGSALSNTLCYLYVREMLDRAIPGGLTNVHVLNYVDDLVIIDNNHKRLQQTATNLLNGLMGLKASAHKSAANCKIEGQWVRRTNVFYWTIWQFNAKHLKATRHHRLALSRMSILSRHSRFGRVRDLALKMKRSGHEQLQRLPRDNLELRKLGGDAAFSELSEIAEKGLPFGLYRRFYLRRRSAFLRRSSYIKKEQLNLKAERMAAKLVQTGLPIGK